MADFLETWSEMYDGTYCSTHQIILQKRQDINKYGYMVIYSRIINKIMHSWRARNMSTRFCFMNSCSGLIYIWNYNQIFGLPKLKHYTPPSLMCWAYTSEWSVTLTHHFNILWAFALHYKLALALAEAGKSFILVGILNTYSNDTSILLCVVHTHMCQSNYRLNLAAVFNWTK